MSQVIVQVWREMVGCRNWPVMRVPLFIALRRNATSSWPGWPLAPWSCWMGWNTSLSSWPRSPELWSSSTICRQPMPALWAPGSSLWHIHHPSGSECLRQRPQPQDHQPKYHLHHPVQECQGHVPGLPLGQAGIPRWHWSSDSHLPHMLRPWGPTAIWWLTSTRQHQKNFACATPCSPTRTFPRYSPMDPPPSPERDGGPPSTGQDPLPEWLHVLECSLSLYQQHLWQVLGLTRQCSLKVVEIPTGDHHAMWKASYKGKEEDEDGAASGPQQWRASPVRRRLVFCEAEEEQEQVLAWRDKPGPKPHCPRPCERGPWPCWRGWWTVTMSVGGPALWS